MTATHLHPGIPMAELLAIAPGARRALFAKYHIGGCSSCGFQPDETLAQVCARNDNLPPEEVIAHLQTSAEEDRLREITPGDLQHLLAQDTQLAPLLLDIRTREEWEAVHIPGAQLLTQETLAHLIATTPKDTPLILCDHTGERVQDAAAYLAGHGFTHARALLGGIDQWSQQIDPTLPRYHLETE